MANNDSRQGYLRRWYANYPGQLLAQAENRLLNQFLPALFGYYLLEYGNLKSIFTLKENRILNTLNVAEAGSNGSNPDGYLDYAQMPFSEAAVDAVFLPHIVEFAEDVDVVLLEAGRLLMPEGYLILLGFNPYSLLGLWQLAKRYFQKDERLGRFRAMSRLIKQLKAQDFKIVTAKTCFYRPPLASRSWLNRCVFLEMLGRICWPDLGASYLIIAQKKVMPLSPIRVDWKTQVAQLGKQAVTPSTRSQYHDPSR